jgi:alkylation response protein AidB-like acyl-CoA dehydrogenase
MGLRYLDAELPAGSFSELETAGVVLQGLLTGRRSMPVPPAEETMTSTSTRLATLVDTVSPELRERASAYDSEGRFVDESYRILREHGFFGAGVPVDLGGLGATHAELCDALRRLAHACPATALAASMHTHLVAANVWKHVHGKGGEGVLRRVAAEQLVLVSTGASDWLESNGTLERVDGGYLATAKKSFASGSPAGDLIVTSAVYDDPVAGRTVLHFAVPLRADGVRVASDWDTLGMRGTGSNTVHLERVRVPDESIVLERVAGAWHPFWSVVLTVAAPIYMAPYVGIAESARDRAVEAARSRRDRPEVALGSGELEGTLTVARLGLGALVDNAAGYAFEPTIEGANRALIAKSITARAAIETVDKAMEAAGGGAYFRRAGLERLLRDVRAAGYHPLPERRQQMLTGRVALGLDPV